MYATPLLSAIWLLLESKISSVAPALHVAGGPLEAARPRCLLAPTHGNGLARRHAPALHHSRGALLRRWRSCNLLAPGARHEVVDERGYPAPGERPDHVDPVVLPRRRAAKDRG